jgi:pimeloyl-ACP methyl ester carboxylesterase
VDQPIEADQAVTTIGQRVDAIPRKSCAAGARVFTYRERGQGPVLVLLHGIGANAGSWIHQLEALSERFRVIAWDAPGYGGSTPLVPSTPSAADYARALESFVDALGLSRFVLVGHSLGALMAGAFAASHPARLQGLVLLSPAGGYGTAHPVLRMDRLNARLKMMETLGPEGVAEQRSANLLTANAPAEALELVQLSMRQLDPRGHEQAARMLANGKLVDDLVKYTGPTVVACGMDDTVTLPDDCRRIAAITTSRELHLLPRLGHACYAEGPAMVNEVILGLAKAAGVVNA